MVSGRIEVFVPNSAGDLLSASFDGQNFTSWTNLGHPVTSERGEIKLASAPTTAWSPVPGGQKNLDVFWIDTRQRLIAEGRLSYIDIARVTGSRLTFRAR